MNDRITKVFLLNVPLENDYKHTLYFNSLEGQYDYFSTRTVKIYDDFSYQRKDSYIRVPDHFDNLQNVNYVMYQNSAYSNKWFYAFVTDIKYVSDDRTDIYIETDVMQTWYFDMNIKPSFVEREHVDDDTIGLHTIDENLELGDMVSSWHIVDDELRSTKTVIASTVFPIDTAELYGGNYNGIYSGVRYYEYSTTDNDPTNWNQTSMDEAIKSVVDSSSSDAIQAVFVAPNFLLPQTNGTHMIDTSNVVASYEWNLHKRHDDGLGSVEGKDGYKPRNNKLLCYPYKYLYVNNGTSGEVIYKYEQFKNSSCNFKVEGVLSPGCSIRLIPLNYKGISRNDSEGLNASKYPICNYSCDLYTNWITQNGVNVATNIIGGVIGGATTGAIIGGIPGAVIGGVSTVSSIANALQSVKNAQMQPPQTGGNINCGDVVSASKNNTFHFYHMSIKKEYAEIIDKYFDMFGYKVNMVKKPNTHHRSRYWYTKTIDVNIDGAIPNKDMQKIKDCYNNGITFWRNANEIQNYELTNEIKNIV